MGSRKGAVPCCAGPSLPLPLPESRIAVPATLVSGLGCLRRAAAPAKRKNARRSTIYARFCGSVVAGILDSCSGYAGFRPCMVACSGAAVPGKRKNARRSTIYVDFTLYRGFGCAGLCRGRSPG